MKVTYQDHMGDDLQVVNAARVSFSGQSEWENEDEVWVNPFIDETRHSMQSPWVDPVLKPKDTHLIKFLARGCTTKDWEGLVDDAIMLGYHPDKAKEETIELLNHVKRMPSHWVPFANGGQIKLHFKVPLFVARQLQKHTAGFNPWSEVSRRYVDSDPEFYVPDVWRGRSADKKQGSSGVVPDNMNIPLGYKESMDVLLERYVDMLSYGVAPEQARMVLPQSMYTEFVWSGNLYAWASLYCTRSWGDSQAETANVAQQIKEIVEPLFPVSWKELTQ